LYELPLPYSLYIGLGIGYSVLNGKLTADDYQDIRIDNTLQKAKIEYTIDTKISDLFVEPYLAYNIFGGLDISFGGHIGYVIKNDFQQYEKLIEPSDHGYFENTGTRIRNDISGKIDSLKTIYSGITFGLSYNLRLDRDASFLLVPAISYMIGMSDFFNDKLLFKTVGIIFLIVILFLIVADFKIYQKKRELIKQINVYEKKIEEIKKSSQTLNDEIANKSNDIEVLKQQVNTLSVENGNLRQQVLMKQQITMQQFQQIIRLPLTKPTSPLPSAHYQQVK
ncbi:MAG: hypothetical protein WCI45_14840, partial [Desulfuromonadales bacterium]